MEWVSEVAFLYVKLRHDGEQVAIQLAASERDALDCARTLFSQGAVMVALTLTTRVFPLRGESRLLFRAEWRAERPRRKLRASA